MINIRYAQIRECDISNGENVGVALFIQGCHFHCKNCFNPETWDFSGGKKWTGEIENRFIELANRPYIKRISILGGEPLADENLDGVLHLVNRLCFSFPQKEIWIYSGYTWENIFNQKECDRDKVIEELIDDMMKNNTQIDLLRTRYKRKNDCYKRTQIVRLCDVLVDGQYMDSQRNISLKWCGSSNQRVILIKQSLKQGKVITIE